MANKISNPADISEKNCKILSSYWKEIYNQENTPSNFFAALPHDLMAEFNEKLELHCRQILTKGLINGHLVNIELITIKMMGF